MHLLRILLPVLLPRGLAQTTTDSVSIYTQSRTYSYHGCYNETTEIDGSDHSRALSGGANTVRKGEMTVPACLDFCAKGDDGTQYLECWCSQKIAGISKKLDDAECNFPCEGNKTFACGGSLKLSVYKLSAASAESASSLLLLSLVTAAAMSAM
ncbi:hypothetical protein EsDP_00000662 [Epichloe bromicola]|uniref:WSC domain-containing protein n=1 Tax=Epichloe bromicola TaxID=79588 RepID=A0ABQ0CFJ5_9HYPO